MKTAWIFFWLGLFSGTAFSAGIPKDAHERVFAQGWECNEGFYQQGQHCAAVIVPEHGRLNVLGNGWECEAGYSRKGEACVVMRAPEHAQLDMFGKGWHCLYGYRQENDACVPVLLDKRTEAALLEAAPVPIPNAGPEGTACHAGYNKCTSACCASVYDRKTDRVLKNSDFMVNCTRACAEAAGRCDDDGSQDACGVFASVCRDNCPEVVHDLVTGQYVSETNARDVCVNACRQGMSRCAYHARRFSGSSSL
jgi:hypothetical protein